MLLKIARELRQFVNTAFHNFNKPYFIRIPRGSIDDIKVDYNNQLELGTWTIESCKDDYKNDF